jgi:hypothetical protein
MPTQCIPFKTEGQDSQDLRYGPHLGNGPISVDEKIDGVFIRIPDHDILWVQPFLSLDGRIWGIILEIPPFLRPGPLLPASPHRIVAVLRVGSALLGLEMMH